MRSDRPTFSESWYRLANLTPRLPSAVKIHRQHFRGRKWYVLQNPVNNEFFRLSDSAYHFVAMLDGRHTVNQVWRNCMEKFGDSAPTQGEVIDVLGRLYQSNLLQTELAPDAEQLFRRCKERARRRVQGFLANILFIRIPLWDPDGFLDLWEGLFGKFFSRWGLLAWTVIIGAGLWAVLGRLNELASGASAILHPRNLPLLYAGLVVLKFWHEMGHAAACKHFGKREGSGGEVHKMGVTFLIFTPLPFVDASSAWALRNKYHRVIVGASGVLVELAAAAAAAVVWTQTPEGGTLNAISYNLIFIAGVSAVLFNGNPFLRYDAYYILSDLLEIPNLESRSKSYACYLVKRYIWGLKKADDPSRTKREKGWLVFYAAASIICRIVVASVIVITIGSQYLTAGIIIGAVLFGALVVVPSGKLLRYLATDREIDRVRPRAVLITLAAASFIMFAAGMVNQPDRLRVEGVVEPVKLAVVHMEAAGFVTNVFGNNQKASPEGPSLIEAVNPELEARKKRLLAEIRQLRIRRRSARTRETAETQVLDEKIAALEEQIARNNQRLQALHLKAPMSGVWLAPDIDLVTGTYLRRGDKVGVVADLENLRVRAVAGQKEAALLIKEADPVVEMRLKGRPDIAGTGRIETILPAGHENLPSAALGYTAGGAVQVETRDPSGKLASEPFFEILVTPAPEEGISMRPGQRVVLRFETSPKPLIAQGWRELLQQFHPKFNI